jgi:hypothetical protein
MATAVAPGEYTLVYLVYNTIANFQTHAEPIECFRNAGPTPHIRRSVSSCGRLSS